MAASPDHDDELVLLQRLLAGDPTASSDLAEAFLDPLAAWLTTCLRGVDPHLYLEAAGQALLDFIKRPAAYRPEKQTLEAYLRLAALCDLRNLRRSEFRHQRGRVPWNSVEHSEDVGKYLGRDDDPSLPMQQAEAEAELWQAVPVDVLDGLTDDEVRGVGLLLHGERSSAVWAETCGLTQLPAEEQVDAVNRLKDKLKHRWKRARQANE
ncbi:MAG: hypothetical protein JNM56_20235 [Planctomycetia bacterium]|nr:hypothetical protein [Planctomycetia bacterium]